MVTPNNLFGQNLKGQIQDLYLKLFCCSICFHFSIRTNQVHSGNYPSFPAKIDLIITYFIKLFRYLAYNLIAISYSKFTMVIGTFIVYFIAVSCLIANNLNFITGFVGFSIVMHTNFIGWYSKSKDS